MSITTFGRIHQSNMEEIDNEKQFSEINEKLLKNENDISNFIEEFHKKKQIDDKRNDDIWNKFLEQDKKSEEYINRRFDELQYNLSKLDSKLFTVEKNLDDLYIEYTRINTKTIREIFTEIDLKFKTSHDEIEKVSNKIMKQMKDSLNDILMKIENNKIQIEFQQNIENKTLARMLDIETAVDGLIKTVHENGKRIGLRTYASLDEALIAEPNANYFHKDPISNLFRVIGYSKNNED